MCDYVLLFIISSYKYVPLHMAYSYYVEHYVSLAGAGLFQTLTGRIAMSH